MYLTTGGIAFQGPRYQDAIDNVFPILKEFVINRMDLISISTQQQHQSKKKKTIKSKIPTPERPKKKFKVTGHTVNSKKPTATLNDVSTNIVNSNDSLKDLQSALIKTIYDDVNEKLTNQLDNINKTMKDILSENKSLNEKVNKLTQEKVPAKPSLKPNENDLLIQMSDEIIELRKEVNREITCQLAELQDSYNKQVELNKSLKKKIASLCESVDNLITNNDNKPVPRPKKSPEVSNSNNEDQQKELCLIGDSLVKYTEVDRLMSSCKGKFSDSKKFISNTINNSETLVKSLDNTPKAFLVHLGANDLKTSSTLDAAKSMINLCDSMLKKNKENTVLISKVLPKLEGRKTNQEISKFNWEVENHYIDNDRVSFSMNDNFSRSGLVEERLYKGGKDTVHLNNEGVRLLSGNLINGLKRLFNFNLNAPFRKYRHDMKDEVIILGDPSGDIRGREIFWPLIMSSRLKVICWNVQGLNLGK